MDNIIIAIGIIAIVGAAAYALYYFMNLGKEKQIQIIREWLLLAVIKAEKELGDGTGQVKLRYVYDLFLDKFKFASLFITVSNSSVSNDSYEKLRFWGICFETSCDLSEKSALSL